MVKHSQSKHYSSIFRRKGELKINPLRCENILIDEIIELKGAVSKGKYHKKFRRVAIWDEKNQQTIELITNQMSWIANTISELYKSRWQIEIFFREIKNLLHIKSFVGTSENAVMIQI